MVKHTVLQASQYARISSRLQEMPPAAMRGVQLASRNRRPCGASSRSTLPRHSRASRIWRNGTHARPLNSAAGSQDSGGHEVHDFEGSWPDRQCSLSCAFLRHTVYSLQAAWDLTVTPARVPHLQPNVVGLRCAVAVHHKLQLER